MIRKRCVAEYMIKNDLALSELLETWRIDSALSKLLETWTIDLALSKLLETWTIGLWIECLWRFGCQQDAKTTIK